jgi:hypothetical protein
VVDMFGYRPTAFPLHPFLSHEEHQSDLPLSRLAGTWAADTIWK